MNLQEVLNLAKQLSPIDKVRLLQQMAFELENELRDKPTATHQHHQPQHQPQQPPQHQPQQPPPPQPHQEPPNWDMSANTGQRPSVPDIDPSRWDDWASFPD